jgi:cell division inhibitor SepF
MNLESVDREVARRIVDFLSGAVYALDGNIQKVSNGIFLIAPYNVGIMGDFKDELRNKGIFPWSN